MKKTVLMALLALSITLFPSAALAISAPVEQQQQYATIMNFAAEGNEMPSNDINVNANMDDSFSDKTYIIKSTGATSGNHYRVSAITIAVGGRTATIDISKLISTPAPGSTVYSQICVTKENLIKAIGEQYRSETTSLLQNAVKVRIGANVQIYNAVTPGDVLATIFTKADVLQVANKYGFGSQDIIDMQNKWQKISLLNKKPVIVGAAWDLPPVYSESRDGWGVNYIDVTGNYNTWDMPHFDLWIDLAANVLASGENLLVAGGPCGPVSNSMYQTIINQAAKINPKHTGSIIRIGGVDRAETQRLVDDFLLSARYY